MAIISMKQTVTVTRQGETDEWGEGGEAVTFALKCRVDERTTVVKNQLGEEVVAGMDVTLDKLADIRYDDVIEYTNELGVTVKRSPIKIEPTRFISGKPILTTVYL